MKKLLIVSPYFPPDNTADMHRIRQSVKYYIEFGWEVQVLCVDPKFTEAYKDFTLLQTIPSTICIHSVKAASATYTRKVGLGSIALRSLYPMYRKGIQIIREWKPDLVFISTTQFPSMILGAWWKKKFNIPYVLDFQDPWHHDHYLKLPPAQRPPKFWFSYRLNKFLEPLAVKTADGLIAVSQAYINNLKERYSEISQCPSAVIPFGASEDDILPEFETSLPEYFPIKQTKNIRIVYTGVINQEMLPVIRVFLVAFKALILEQKPGTLPYHLYFIGTSYGTGMNRKYKLGSLIKELELDDYLTEIPERVSFLSALQMQKHADLLFLPGTTDQHYIASKLAPYLISGRPIFSIFRKSSAAYPKLIEQARVKLVPFESEQELSELSIQVKESLEETLINRHQISLSPVIHAEWYSAKELTQRQTELFDRVIKTMNN